MCSNVYDGAHARTFIFLAVKFVSPWRNGGGRAVAIWTCGKKYPPLNTLANAMQMSVDVKKYINGIFYHPVHTVQLSSSASICYKEKNTPSAKKR